MKVLLLVCLLGVSQLSAEYIYFPWSPEFRNVGLQFPGRFMQNVATQHKPLPEIGNRRNFGFGSTGLAANSPAPSPVTFQSTAITATAPLCLACTCKVGKTTCAEAGGISYRTSGAAIGGGFPVACTASKPCVAEAPATMSACDPLCKKRGPTCDITTSLASSVSCTENVDTTGCGTICQHLNAGDKVICDPQAIAEGAVNDIPKNVCPPIGKRRRRDDAGAAQHQARFIANPFLSHLLTSPPPATRIPGGAVLSYAPTGSCIPYEIANAPICTQL